MARNNDESSRRIPVDRNRILDERLPRNQLQPVTRLPHELDAIDLEHAALRTVAVQVAGTHADSAV